MPPFGDNPFEDGLDFIGCPPRPTDLRLPEFPPDLEGDCKLICWGLCMPVPDGERKMEVFIVDFRRDPGRCGVYLAKVRFVDALTNQDWYTGELEFHYTRNYVHTDLSLWGQEESKIAFRFVVKGDLMRVSERMPEWTCFVLCTKKSDEIRSYDSFFVYGGLDLLYDAKAQEMTGFRLGLGHNDGWYTHHPNCSARPIDWNGAGDYIGHYCDRGWLFVSPGENFVFNPNLPPPTGRFLDEALRQVGNYCYTEEAIEYGVLRMRQIQCIHQYQELRGVTECETPFRSVEFCQGMVHSGERHPWLTFFSMGYWFDPYQRQTLHLAEGSVHVQKEGLERFEKGLYCYGFATQYGRQDLKLVDLSSNEDIIGMPAETRLLLYFYNAGRVTRDPKVRRPDPIDPKLTARLLRERILRSRDRDLCPFLEEPGKTS
jgi:hypothetical protein